MLPKKTLAPAAKTPSRAAFVLGLPESVSADEVVAKAKAAGIKLRRHYVFEIRANARRTKKSQRPSASKPAARRAAPSLAKVGGAEGSFVELALAIGLGRSEALLARVRRVALGRSA